MVKVLIVDDSAVVRDFLAQILESDLEIRVVGTARDGKEAIEAIRGTKPDVVTMDLNMPNMDGYQATRTVMETAPVPIVVVSASIEPGEIANTFRALEAGAVAAVAQPRGVGHPDHEKTVRELIRNVKAMAEVRLVRRWPRVERKPAAHPLPGMEVRPERPDVRVVAIGASTGGPIVIRQLLASLPRDFPAPVLIVQHMAAGFITGFAEWLAQSSEISVKVAAHGESVGPGFAYVAPHGFNMGVDRSGRIALGKSDNVYGPCPSVSHLFRSVAEAYGKNAVGVLLTGMGRDGAEELRLMKERGAVTIAQDEASSPVYGMPGAAALLKAAKYMLSPDSIAELLKRLVTRDGS